MYTCTVLLNVWHAEGQCCTEMRQEITEGTNTPEKYIVFRILGSRALLEKMHFYSGHGHELRK